MIFAFPSLLQLFQTRTGSSSAIGFSHDMINHQMHSIHQDLMQVGMPGFMNPIDVFRRELNVQLPSTSGYKEASQQVWIISFVYQKMKICRH